MESDLGKYLPPDYNYKIEFEEFSKEDEFDLQFCINISNPDDFELWKMHFVELNQMTLRISQTKKFARFVIYNREFVCHHNAAHGVLGKGKHTGCPFKINVIIYDYINDPHPCKIKLKYKHNHILNSPFCLHHLRVPKLLEEKIIGLFLSGHNIKSARATILNDIRENLKIGDSFQELLANRSIYPDESYFRRVFSNVINCADKELQYFQQDSSISKNLKSSYSAKINSNDELSNNFINNEIQEIVPVCIFDAKKYSFAKQCKDNCLKMFSARIEKDFQTNAEEVGKALLSFENTLKSLNEVELLTALYQFSKAKVKDEKNMAPLQKNCFLRKKKFIRGRKFGNLKQKTYAEKIDNYVS